MANPNKPAKPSVKPKDKTTVVTIDPGTLVGIGGLLILLPLLITGFLGQ